MSDTYDETTMRQMGELNAGWGICGVTSTFYAMYQNNAGARGVLVNAPRPFSVLAELKTFLAMLKGTGKLTMINDIETFTRSFGGVFSAFTVDAYIAYVNDSLSTYINKPIDPTGDETLDARIFDDERFGIGLPPEVVAEYARSVWGYSGTVAMADQSGDAIVGVRNTTRWFNSFRLYGGLVHYLYRKDGKYYSWGDPPFNSLTEAKPYYAICCSVKLAKA